MAGLGAFAVASHPLRPATGNGVSARLDVVVTADPRPVRSTVPGPGRVVVRGELLGGQVGAGVPWRAGGRVSCSSRPPRTGRGCCRARSSAPGAGSPSARPRRPHRRGPAGPRARPARSGRCRSSSASPGDLRGGLRDAARAVLAEDPAGLLPGLVVGDTSGVSPGLADDFRTAGLTHLTAVSGTNVAIICGAVLLLARLARAGPRTAAVLAALALVGFVVLARPSPSVLRAAVMGGVTVLALAVGRRRSVVPALCAAVIVLLLVDPGLATDPGFALSVLATGALVLLAPGMVARWRARGVPPGHRGGARGARRRARGHRAGDRGPVRRGQPRRGRREPARRAGDRAGHRARRARRGGRAVVGRGRRGAGVARGPGGVVAGVGGPAVRGRPGRDAGVAGRSAGRARPRRRGGARRGGAAVAPAAGGRGGGAGRRAAGARAHPGRAAGVAARAVVAGGVRRRSGRRAGAGHRRAGPGGPRRRRPRRGRDRRLPRPPRGPVAGPGGADAPARRPRRRARRARWRAGRWAGSRSGRRASPPTPWRRSPRRTATARAPLVGLGPRDRPALARPGARGARPRPHRRPRRRRGRQRGQRHLGGAPGAHPRRARPPARRRGELGPVVTARDGRRPARRDPEGAAPRLAVVAADLPHRGAGLAGAGQRRARQHLRPPEPGRDGPARAAAAPSSGAPTSRATWPWSSAPTRAPAPPSSPAATRARTRGDGESCPRTRLDDREGRSARVRGRRPRREDTSGRRSGPPVLRRVPLAEPATAPAPRGPPSTSPGSSPWGPPGARWRRGS